MTTGFTPRGIQYLDDQQEQPEVIFNHNVDAEERYVAGTFIFNFDTDADYTLATAPTTGGDPPEWQYGIIGATDTGAVLTTGRHVIFPAIGNRYVVANDTLQILTIKTPVTGSQGRSLDPDKVREIMVTAAGNVFALGAQAALTVVT